MSDEDREPLIVHKNEFVMLIDARLLPGYVPTEGERIENERRRRENAEKTSVAVAAFETARGRWAVLITDQTQPKVLHDLLVLHAPALQYQSSYHPPMFHDLTYVSCLSCESGEDHHTWPCPSAEVLAAHYGIEVADWYGIPVRDVMPG